MKYQTYIDIRITEQGKLIYFKILRLVHPKPFFEMTQVILVCRSVKKNGVPF